MKKTAEQFDREFRTAIPSIIFYYIDGGGELMTVKSLHDGLSKDYDITRYKAESRARLLVGELLEETTKNGKKAFCMMKEAFDLRKRNPPTLVGSGYDVDNNRDELDRAILMAVRAGMSELHKLPHARCLLESDKHAAWLCGIRYKRVIELVHSKEENRHIADSSIRGRCEILIKQGRLIKGKRLGSNFPALVVRSHYLKLNRKISKNPSRKDKK